VNLAPVGNRVIDMALDVKMIIFDCSDPAKLAGWCAEQLISGTPEQLFIENVKAVSLPEGTPLGFLALPDPIPGKSRVHLDFCAADLDAGGSPTAATGVNEVGGHTLGDNFRRVVLADREGDVFCMVGRRPPRGQRAAEARHSRNTVRPRVSRCDNHGGGNAAQAAIRCPGGTVGRPRARVGQLVGRHESRLPPQRYGVDHIEAACKRA
jgi:hypothetical protein